MRSFVAVAALMIGLTGSGAHAQLTPADASGVSDRFKLISAGHRQSLRAYQTDMARQQRADGGTLTPAHAAAFRKRLANMNDYYARAIHNADPRSVDANGMPIG